jgi:hypothetical protein
MPQIDADAPVNGAPPPHPAEGPFCHDQTHTPLAGADDPVAGRLAGHGLDPAAGAAARRAAIAAGEQFTRDLLDAPYWVELAQAAQVRLPQWHVPATPANLERWLRSVGIPVAAFLSWAGYKRLSDAARLNPSWGLRPWAGLTLEQRTQMLDGEGNDDGAED